MKRLIKKRLCHRVIITLKDGTGFAGLLYQADSEALILRQAEALDVGNTGKPVGVDGELLILRPEVSYIQLPG